MTGLKAQWIEYTCGLSQMDQSTTSQLNPHQCSWPRSNKRSPTSYYKFLIWRPASRACSICGNPEGEKQRAAPNRQTVLFIRQISLLTSSVGVPSRLSFKAEVVKNEYS